MCTLIGMYVRIRSLRYSVPISHIAIINILAVTILANLIISPPLLYRVVCFEVTKVQGLKNFFK